MGESQVKKCERWNLQSPAVLAGLVAVIGAGAVILPESAFAQTNNIRFYEACGRLLYLIEGPFGALLTVGAGIGAIVSAAVGGFRTAWALVVVSVGAFILRSYITLFFAPCFIGGVTIDNNFGVGGPAFNFGIGGPVGGVGFGVGGPAGGNGGFGVGGPAPLNTNPTGDPQLFN